MVRRTVSATRPSPYLRVGRDYAGYKVLTVVGEDEAAALEGLLFGFGDFQQIHRLHIFINIDIVTQPRLPVKSKLPRRLS